MTDKRWNDDIAYVFSTHRQFLRIYGLWPLQAKTVFTKIRWGFCMIAQFAIIPFVMMDIFWSNQNTNSSIDHVVFIISTITGITRSLCITANQKKLSTNINAAIDDWLSAEYNKEIKEIMKKYAIKAKMLTFTLLYSLIVVYGLFVSVIIFINLKQVFFTDTSVNVNTTNWLFFIPSGSLSSSITGSQYAIILTIQIIQIAILAFILCLTDSFFFNITIHLCGQLEILKNKFGTFTNKPDTKINYRKKFISLINRHKELTELYQNLEDCFHFLILFQLVESTLLLAIIGLRLTVYLNEKIYIEATKSIFMLNYCIMQPMVFTYGGEFLQKKSEDIFYALYTTSWYTLPLALLKDLHFAMMRLSIPFRLTGGKFFYINRETMMSIFKTAVSYVSVLRIAIKE
ncbi:uncharacterized protein LOC105835825 [Monomorium pharaonis]|uniref:uncharacterized protein LOC105835825 n=1 Tax=Monomorium pharaonis TaxID=307658 RepID=UPI00063FCEF9|nr:uncharacterized protein LOC105835825 [Monomorium pharaonis]